MGKGEEGKVYEEWLISLGFFSPQKRLGSETQVPAKL